MHCIKLTAKLFYSIKGLTKYGYDVSIPIHYVVILYQGAHFLFAESKLDCYVLRETLSYINLDLLL